MIACIVVNDHVFHAAIDIRSVKLPAYRQSQVSNQPSNVLAIKLLPKFGAAVRHEFPVLPLGEKVECTSFSASSTSVTNINAAQFNSISKEHELTPGELP